MRGPPAAVISYRCQDKKPDHYNLIHIYSHQIESFKTNQTLFISQRLQNKNIHLKYINHGTDDCVREVFFWEETRVPGGNPPVRLGIHTTILHAPLCFKSC